MFPLSKQGRDFSLIVPLLHQGPPNQMSVSDPGWFIHLDWSNSSVEQLWHPDKPTMDMKNEPIPPL